MDEIKRQVAETRDKEAAEKHAKQLRELQDSASGKRDEAISHAQLQHLNNLKKIGIEQENFMNSVETMKAEEAEAHEVKKAEAARRADERLANTAGRCEAVTKSTLDNLEEKIAGMKSKSETLEKQMVEAKAKSAEIEVNVGRQMFDEVGAQLDKDEQLTEKRKEELRNQHAAIQKGEEEVLAAERTEKKRNAEMTIAEMRSDLVDQQKVGMLNLAIQQFTDERNSRRIINHKIHEVRGFLEDLDQQFMNAYKVLNATPENYSKLKPKHKKATRAHLARFTELLTSVSSKLNDIEQNLASFEWEDVEMTQISRQIKTQISVLRKIIANLNLILELDDVNIEPAVTEEFAKAKETLFQQINNLDAISEQRSRIVEAIQQRQEESMPDVAKLSIEN